MPPPLVNGIWKMESQFSLRVWLVVEQPHSSRWPNTLEYGQHKMVSIGSFKTKQQPNREHKVGLLGRRGGGGGLVRSEGKNEGQYDQNTLHKVLKECVCLCIWGGGVETGFLSVMALAVLELSL